VYAELYEAWRREKENAEIQALPGDFYARLAEYVERVRREGRMIDKKTVKGRLMERELQNVHRMAEELVNLRYRKAVERTLAERVVPRDVLTGEEERLQGEVLPSTESFQAFLRGVLRGSLAPVGEEGEKGPPRQLVVRFLSDVPAVIGSDMKPYGPFKAEDVASLPVENARILIRQGAAVEVEAK